MTSEPDDLLPTADPAETHSRKFQRELSAGLTSLVLLSVLADAGEDLYGYEIARRLSGDHDGGGPFKLGALYPVLRNMSAAGLLSSRVVPVLRRPGAPLLPDHARWPRGACRLARHVDHHARFRRLHPEPCRRPGGPAMTAATLRTVEQYLDALRSALHGADPALVQDALYDAEEHLRAELGAHPGHAEGDVLARIVTSYGAPDEVAGGLPRQRGHHPEGPAHAHPAAALEQPRPLLRHLRRSSRVPEPAVHVAGARHRCRLLHVRDHRAVAVARPRHPDHRRAVLPAVHRRGARGRAGRGPHRRDAARHADAAPPGLPGPRDAVPAGASAPC